MSASMEPSAEPVDLTNCDREPIHALGRVQGYGALLAVSSDWIVQHVSDNLVSILGVAPEAALGRPLGEFLPASAMKRILGELKGLEAEDSVARLFGLEIGGAGRRFDVSLHRSGMHLLVELEPKGRPRESEPMSQLVPQLQRLRKAGDLAALADAAAKVLRDFSGFDSVMVYRFQTDRSGCVIAEAKDAGRPSYLGLRFPASDIPVQARALYARSLLRLIADVNDEGAGIMPPLTPGGQPLDLSLAVTRAVSPIHIEYLRNMGVQASMSVSIMKDGALWGLFACHHRQPRYIDYEMRTTIELFGHLFAHEIARFEAEERSRAEAQTSALQARLMASMADGADLATGVFAVADDIGSVIEMDGLVLFLDGTYHARGDTPTEQEFEGLGQFLNTTAPSSVFSTDRLPQVHPPAADYRQRTSGILAVPVSRSPRDYLVLCRREVVSSVPWAGDPSKPAQLGPNGDRLTPRKSFETWREMVEGTSQPWTAFDGAAGERLRVLLLEVFLRVTEAANAERKRAQERQELLISELNHRVRNILNLTRGLISQSRGADVSMDAFVRSIDGRIGALARAHDQLTRQDWEPSSVAELIRLEAAAYVNGQSHRIAIEGDDVLLVPEALTSVALVVHELVTNSAKYGALCDNIGRVQITLSEDPGGALGIAWTERGGRPVTPPTRRGFGTTIIETSIPYELKGEADIAYPPEGVEARFVIPGRFVAQAASAPAAANRNQGGPRGDLRLSGRALVVEDSMIIAMDTAAMLSEMGAADVITASSVASAMAEIERELPSVAVLDVNLGSETSQSVAEALAARGVPFVLTTGYGERGDQVAEYPRCPVVQKPLSNETLAEALMKVVGMS